MNTNEEYETEIDLVELFHVIVKKLWIIILVSLFFGAGFGVFTKFFIEPKYKATSSLYILGNSSSSLSLSDLQIGSQLTDDYKELAKSRYVVEKVIKNLKLDTTYKEMCKMIEVSNPANTRFLNINVVTNEPELSQKIANELSETIMDRVVMVMHVDKPSLSERAILPEKPISPNLSKNIVLGALLGMILSGGIIVMIYILDDTIKDEEDIKKYLGLNTIATLPNVKSLRNR